jgi:predicted HAD superfamily Cof-like phosphohydrolase
MVTEFHKTFDITVNDHPVRMGLAVHALRCELIREELEELEDAFGSITKTADAIADLLYVVYGTAVSAGIDIEPIFAEVHRSNMTKVGGHKREDGKWIKPDTYSPANIKLILDSQKKDNKLSIEKVSNGISIKIPKDLNNEILLITYTD